MGTFSYAIEVGDPEGQRFETIDALVDTGASYTTMPTSTLERLGVQRTERRQFRLADERVIERDIGQTWIRIDGRGLVRVVVFSEGDQALLGADSLEGFGLAVDPVARRLIPVPGLLMAASTQQKGKQAELLVIGELIRRGVPVYLPVVDIGIDAIVKPKHGPYLEIQVKATEAENQAGWFNVYDLDSYHLDRLFVVCVDMQKEQPEVWILPAAEFKKHATVWTSKEGWKRYTLGMPARERRCGNRRRSDILEQYCATRHDEAWKLLIEGPAIARSTTTEATQDPSPKP